MDGETAARKLAEAGSQPVLVEAPAGCGKTHTIAQAVALSKSGVQLILTHTNAGVASIRDKLRDRGVPSKSYHVDTIDGWAQRIASYFPLASGYHIEMSWPEKRSAALRLLDYEFAHRLIMASHVGLYVDEYQDCGWAQHRLVLRLAEWLPCRILGDHLQAVFEFEKNDPVVDWDRDVVSNFTKLGVLTEPWRWKAKGANPKLGEWLKLIRDDLAANQPIDLTDAPVCWKTSTHTNQNEIAACKERSSAQGSVAVIHRLPNGAHHLAAQLGGTYQSMEEMECEDLLNFARNISVSTGRDRALVLMDTVEKCFIHPTETFAITTMKDKLKNGRALKTVSAKPHIIAITEALAGIMNDDSFVNVRSTIAAMEKMPGAKLCRRELWTEIKHTLDSYLESPSQFANLVEAATQARGRTRIIGRRPEIRTVSRVLLIKGLEFDHVIVTDADSFTAKELYVALSRGKRTVTVLSKDRKITPVKRSPTKSDCQPMLFSLDE